MKTITLQANKQKPIIFGHPWVFPKAIAAQDRGLQCGDVVAVFAADGRRVGSGVYNPNSLYRVRMLAYTKEDLAELSLEEIVSARLRAAKSLRHQLGLPNATTNAFRLFNSEGDGLSGLTIDIYNTIAVVASSAYWTQANRELIENCLQKIYPVETILWFGQKKSLQQDGWQDVNNTVIQQQVSVKSHGIQFAIDFSETQKTGLYLDQQDNHRRIAELTRDKKVLDLYCYTGGFALHAAKAGAAKVTAIDSSPAAIAAAQKNAQANGLEQQIEFIAADAREMLSTAKDYDLVILDPPKIIPSRRHIKQGEQYYRFLHNELFKVLRQDTLVFSCNCSAAMEKERFAQLINQASHHQQRELRFLGAFGPALDHPLLEHFPEGNYLHAILIAIS